MRRITLFVLAIIMVLFAGITTQAAYAQQADTQQPTGNEESIVYKGETYTKLSPIPTSDPTFRASVCGTATIAYLHTSTTGVEVICSRDMSSTEIYLVSFPNATVTAGSDQVSSFGTLTTEEADAAEAIQNRFQKVGLPSGPEAAGAPKNPDIPLPAIAQDEARYKAFYDKFYANIKSTDHITFGNPDTNSTAPTTTCDSKNTHGIGWVICPVTNWLAAGMDYMYDIISSFMIVTPLSTNKTSPLYYAWSIMRNLANIMFIIGFLAIIYSQITNTGLSSHGVKQLLPRLVIAAILVNVSYWLTAVAVDISNILGVNLKNIFDQVVDNIQKNADPAWSGMEWKSLKWEDISGFILSGGAATFAVASLVGGVIATAGGSLWLLLGALMGVMVSALVAILVLAARQALITLFIVISPLAFVAYLLPSTEKYFHRWRELFTTMLLMFPIFSVVFGAAQLAGILIIYSATPHTRNFLNILILGMVVQVAPLIITPLLIKVSGSLLGRVAGIVNDPNKGLIDKTKNFAQSQSDRRKNRQLWRRNEDGSYTYNNPLAMGGRRLALRSMNRERELKAWEGGAEAAYANDHRSHEVHRQHEINEMRKNAGESHSKAEFDTQLATNELLRKLYYKQQQTHEEAEAASKNIATQWEGLKAAPDKITGISEAERKIGEEAKEVDRQTRSLAARESIAKHVQEKNYNAEVQNNANTELREFAGFNQIDPHGVAQVVNIAQEASAKSYSTLVEAAQRALQREEATLEEVREIITNGTSSNPKFAHFKNDVESRSAAIRQYVSMASMKQVQELEAELDLSKNAVLGTPDGVIRSEFAGAIKNTSGKKPFYVSSTFLAQMIDGKMDPILNGASGRNEMILDALNKGAFDSELMVTMDQDDIKAISDFLDSPQRARLSTDAEKQIINALTKTFDKRDRYEGRIGKRRGNLNLVRGKLGLPEIRD